MEVTTYLEAALTSELSANVIDLCPVGALTSKPYAFNARPWELTKTETIDVMDALGCNIRVDARGDAVLRVLPRVNEEINEEWISDKTRYAEDGLSRQRLDRPYIRENGALRPATWGEALGAAAVALRGDAKKIGAIAGDLACAESMKAALDLFRALGSPNTDCRADGAQVGGGARQGYLFNSTIAGIDEADAILLIGTNPRIEAPVLNARIRKAYLRGAEIGVVGEAADLSYKYAHLGAGPSSLSDLGAFADTLKNARRPMVIVGAGALARDDGGAVLRAAGRLTAGLGKDGWSAFNVLHSAASRVGGLDLGFLPSAGGKSATEMLAGGMDALLLLGVDEVTLPSAGTIIYIGTHGDAGAHRADIILPGAAYTEKDATWVNTEGRVQYGRRATFPKGDAKEDWAILRALSSAIGNTLPYDTIGELRAKMIADHPTFGQVDYAPGAADAASFDTAKVGSEGKLSNEPFKSQVTDFYLTNPIARASKTMAECSRLRADGSAKVAAE
jgi:NADH-quinone oxidoreductase subunit G